MKIIEFYDWRVFIIIIQSKLNIKTRGHRNLKWAVIKNSKFYVHLLFEFLMKSDSKIVVLSINGKLKENEKD